VTRGIKMKKYTNKHLEKVPVEFIIGCERTVECLQNELSVSGCPVNNLYRCDDEDDFCPRFLKYRVPHGTPVCPCVKFGGYTSIEMLKNLIAQWKKWAGLSN
jgi:hypothetical protein